MFTARTTRVSNPICSPSFRPSPSDPFWSGVFTTGSLPRIITFYRSPRHTPDSSRSQVIQCLLHADRLSLTISQEIYITGYGRFRPNKNGCHSWRWGYRGCWHQSCPPLIRMVFTHYKSPCCYMSTKDSPITLSCSVEFTRLLHPVGLGSVSQYPSWGDLSQGPY